MCVCVIVERIQIEYHSSDIIQFLYKTIEY